MFSEYLTLDRYNDVFVITLKRAPENRLTSSFCQEIIRAFHHIQRTLGPNTPGAIITQGSDAKFWCTGADLEERKTNPYSNSDGLFPMIHTILDFPYPTIALMTGHTFGAGCPFALAHDYRIMNAERGYVCMPPVDLGLHFEGMGALLRLKLSPPIARKMLLEGYRWTSEEAFRDGIVDQIEAPEHMFDAALALAERMAPKATMGVYGVLRGELFGEADRMFQGISYVHSRKTSREAKAKL